MQLLPKHLRPVWTDAERDCIRQGFNTIKLAKQLRRHPFDVYGEYERMLKDEPDIPPPLLDPLDIAVQQFEREQARARHAPPPPVPPIPDAYLENPPPRYR